MNVTVAGYLAIATSLFLSYGLYAQVWKIYRTKSAKDFALPLILALVFNELAWLNYGLRLGQLPVWIIPAFNLPAVIAGIPGYLRYRRPTKSGVG